MTYLFFEKKKETNTVLICNQTEIKTMIFFPPTSFFYIIFIASHMTKHIIKQLFYF